MTRFVHELVSHIAQSKGDDKALVFQDQSLSYSQVNELMMSYAKQLHSVGCERFDRVAVYLPKSIESVVSLFAISCAGGCFVPVNHVLKAPQVAHILNDCAARILITSSDRLRSLNDCLLNCESLQHIILIDKIVESTAFLAQSLLGSSSFTSQSTQLPGPATDQDMVAILYTSGSTGKPKGVVLSHRNIIAGAESVSEYLQLSQKDVILALLPMSFDYGLNQITSSFFSGAPCILMDYFLAGDVVKAIEKHGVTGLAAVPPLWQQLTNAKWTIQAANSLRYFTNSGGAMPLPVLARLRELFIGAKPFLMYGLTEAFRSTYLPPELIDEKPGSMGKAIPNAEILILRPDGSECSVDEPGELVHRGPLVSLGYWNAPEKTAERFKPLTHPFTGLTIPEIAVWSGDTVRRDVDGYLFFVGRHDEMIKTSGYRVSPTEVEDAVYAAHSDVKEVVACGVPDAALGQAIVINVVLSVDTCLQANELATMIKRELPNFMHPKYIEIVEMLPRNANGKVDRSLISKASRERYSA